MVKFFFSTKYMANDDFSEPLEALIQKIPFSFFFLNHLEERC